MENISNSIFTGMTSLGGDVAVSGSKYPIATRRQVAYRGNTFPYSPCYDGKPEGAMDLIWLVALVLGSGFALAGGQKIQGKLFNLLIILGCMSVGLAVGYAAGLGSENMGSVPNAELPFSMIFGIVGAFGCIYLNKAHDAK
jgi:hypothetical protein